VTDFILLRAIAALELVTRWLPRPVREWLWWRVWSLQRWYVLRGVGDDVWVAALSRLCDAIWWGPPLDGDDSGEPF
jgi:hypothetical protein